MIDKEIFKYKNIASIIVIVMLLLAIPSGIWPYGYYQILRWVVTGAALFILWITYELKKKTWLWIMGVIAILFNPIAPIYLDKGTWVVIDLIVAALFLISIFKIKVSNNNL
ncbi:MAG: DUF6804 family protein [Candidatus Paceibacterota bacterium]|jgi:hypothetical protein